jgi:hypothetical protein
MAYHRTNELLLVPPQIEPVTLKEAQWHLRVDEQSDGEQIQALITAARIQIEQWCWSAFITQTWQYWWDRFWCQMFLPRPPIRVGYNNGAIASISTSGTTATVVLSAAAQDQFLATLFVGQSIVVAGASVAGYNGTFAITGLTATGFTYTVAGSLSAATAGTAATGNNGGVQSVQYLLPQALSESPSSYVTLPYSVWETSQENQLPFIRMAYLQTFPVTRGYRDDVTATVVCGYGSRASDVPMPLRHAIKILVAFLYANHGEMPAEIPQAIDMLIGPFRFKEF